MEGKNDTNRTKISIEVDVTNISKTSKNVEIPSGEKVLDFFAEGYYFTEEGTYDLWLSVDDGGADFELAYEHLNGAYVSYQAKIPVTALENKRIEVKPEDIEVYVNYNLYEVELEKSIIVEIISDDQFMFVQFPDLGLAEHSAYKAITDINEGGSRYYIDPSLGIDIEFWNASDNGQIFYDDTYPLETIVFEFETDYKTGRLICTIVGYGTKGNLYDTEEGGVYHGSIPEQIPTLFGGDIEFSFYVTEDGMVTCDDMPTVLPEYVAPRS